VLSSFYDQLSSSSCWATSTVLSEGKLRFGDGSHCLNIGSVGIDQRSSLLLSHTFICVLLAVLRIGDQELEFLKSLWGAWHRGGIGFSCRPARLHRLAEFIPWNQCRGPRNSGTGMDQKSGSQGKQPGSYFRKPLYKFWVKKM
jgi:hypothetical protein